MARLKAFELSGFDLWFNSDDHLPPHFHVEKPGAWELKVHFLTDRSEMFEIVWPKHARNKAGKPKMVELHKIADLVEQRRAELLDQWQHDVVTKTPGPARQ